ncbi:hypothetical protein BDF20DRAFT_881939 [Mycotypha africana]|uniref:uncharacterized protein n=1 Tax=Mycotypha africana TaxID=64632 RepID=UPI0023001BCE|nr:uncharacterized protein BDF20DRAFT_881939 [Mycotypha africana]KAI8973356.1 hypothetical protein BDF20DRAFT_881939 [Mycotypha africana]
MFIHSFNLDTTTKSQLKNTIDIEQLNQLYAKKYSSELDTVLISRQQQLHNNAQTGSENDSNACNVLLCGTAQAALTNVRSDILRNSPIKSTLTINSSNMDALFHPEVKPSLIHIAQTYHIGIKICYHCHHHNICSGPEIHMLGCIDSLEAARVDILVLLDRLSGLVIDRLDDIPQQFHYLIAGRKHSHLQAIMQETATNIYLKSPFAHLHCNQKEDDKKESLALIYLSGESVTTLTRAKRAIKKLFAQMAASVYIKKSHVNSRKLDWVLLNKRDEVRKIMIDNGSFFLFPAVGSGNNSVSIYAENRIYAERSIRLLNHLTSSVYEATFKFNENNSLQKLDNFPLILAQYALASGAEISYDSETYSMNLLGTESQVKAAYQFVSDMDHFPENHKYTIFSVELATDQREFVSGKKNGKINKIMKSCTASIRFTISNEYNSAIIVESDDSTKAMEGFCMLQDELPAETSFYVPEIYHRRIIGVGGKNIQKVMKQYGVYVKFSNTEEFKSMGGYFENEDNVVARTPMKNKSNLDHLREAVTAFIAYNKDKNYVTTMMVVPFPLQRIISSKYAQELRDLCQANSSMIWWPERLGMDYVTVYGPQAQLPLVISYVQQFIDIEKHMVVAIKDNSMRKTLTDPNFIARIRQQLNAECPNIELKGSEIVSDLDFNEPDLLEWKYGYQTEECNCVLIFRLICRSILRQGYHYLETAKEIIKMHIESAGFFFKDLATQHQQDCFQSCQYKQADCYFPSSMLSPGFSEQQYQQALSTCNNTIPTPPATVTGGMPSPPLSETLAPSYSPHHYPRQQEDTINSINNTSYAQQHHNTLFGRVNGMLPPPSIRRNCYHNTYKNIWAAPLLPSGSKNFAPFFGPGFERMNINSTATTAFQRPLSPPQPTSSLMLSSSQSVFHLSNPHGMSTMMKPSVSTPAIGSVEEMAIGHEQQQNSRDKSWPDVFFGGRDLFSTLRNSWNAPYGQRHYF